MSELLKHLQSYQNLMEQVNPTMKNLNDDYFDPELAKSIRENVDSDIEMLNLMEKQLAELKQANAILKSQLDVANKSIEKKEKIIFNQNVQIELQKADYIRQVEKTKQQEARAILAEKDAKKALVREKISYTLTLIAFFIDYRGYILSGLNFILRIFKRNL